MTPVGLADPTPHPVLRFRYDDQVYVVGHQAIRPDDYATALAPFGHQIQIIAAVALIIWCPRISNVGWRQMETPATPSLVPP